MDVILKPVHIATSKPARKTYLNTLLLLIASFFLLCIATFAYILFYLNFIPQIGIDRDVHFQFLPPDTHQSPYAIVPLPSSSLIPNQAYTFTLTLTLPRSPPNLATGNFMLTTTLLSLPATSLPPPTHRLQNPLSTTHHSPLLSTLPSTSILHTSARPALLTYHSPPTILARTLLSLPLHLFSLSRDAETLSVPLIDRVVFAPGSSGIPQTAAIELVTREEREIQLYSAKLRLTARLEGVRWFMYSWRLSAFVIGVGAFWGFEVLFAVLGWVGLKSFFGGRSTSSTTVIKTEGGEVDTDSVVSGAAVKEEEKKGKIKAEEEEEYTETDDPDLSDTPRTFPTYGRGVTPLVYNPPPPLSSSSSRGGRIKREEDIDDGYQRVGEELGVEVEGTAADDESEDVGFGGTGSGRFGRGGGGGGGTGDDSGIGTSYSESNPIVGRGSVVRRKGERGGGGGD